MALNDFAAKYEDVQVYTMTQDSPIRKAFVVCGKVNSRDFVDMEVFDPEGDELSEGRNVNIDASDDFKRDLCHDQ